MYTSSARTDARPHTSTGSPHSYTRGDAKTNTQPHTCILARSNPPASPEMFTWPECAASACLTPGHNIRRGACTCRGDYRTLSTEHPHPRSRSRRRSSLDGTACGRSHPRHQPHGLGRPPVVNVSRLPLSNCFRRRSRALAVAPTASAIRAALASSIGTVSTRNWDSRWSYSTILDPAPAVGECGIGDDSRSGPDRGSASRPVT